MAINRIEGPQLRYAVTMPAQPSCSSATRSIDNSLGGTFLHWCYAPSGRTEFMVSTQGLCSVLGMPASGACQVRALAEALDGSASCSMNRISYRGYRFPPDIIQRAVWLYFRFTLSFRDVEDMLAERGIEVSYETIRQWVMRFGPAIARDLRSRRSRPHGQWHLDEMFVSIGGRWMYLWRAVDAEGEVLDCLVQSRRDTRAELRLRR